jgi:hypothetical protein
VLIGGALEWVVGAGVYTVAGLGAIVSMAAGGSFIGAWAARRAPDYEARYEGRVRRGDILISVLCDDLQWAKKAREILRRAGADDVSSTSKVPADLVRQARTVVMKPTSERTVAAAPLRLVSIRNPERAGVGVMVPREPVPSESHKKSAAS